MLKRIEIRIAGLGGQGVVLAGQVLGKAAIYAGKYAVQTQSYGAEARGSAAKSEVIISNDKVYFPKVIECDILVCMSQRAVEYNLQDLKKDGFLFIDSTGVNVLSNPSIKTVKIPATHIAEETFNQKIFANMIMLGAVIKLTNIIEDAAVKKAIARIVPLKSVKDNLHAFTLGLEFSSKM